MLEGFYDTSEGVYGQYGGVNDLLGGTSLYDMIEVCL